MSRNERPPRYAQWVEQLPDGVEFCLCSGVTWVNRDPTTSRPCRACGKLRNDDICVVGSDDPHHQRRGCRSTDKAHIEHAIWMMTTSQLRGHEGGEAVVGSGPSPSAKDEGRRKQQEMP